MICGLFFFFLNLAMFGHICELIMRVRKSVRGCMCVCGFVCVFRIQTHSSGVWEIKGENQGSTPSHTTVSRRHLCLRPVSDSMAFHNCLDIFTSQLYLNFWNVVSWNNGRMRQTRPLAATLQYVNRTHSFIRCTQTNIIYNKITVLCTHEHWI